MKNILIIAIILLSSTVAKADLSIGDSVLYHITSVNLANGETESIDVNSMVVKIDEESEEAALKQTMYDNDGKIVKEEVNQFSLSNFQTDEEITNLVENCEANGGKLEKISVKAGSFDTCALAIENGTQWIGKVKLGAVKLEFTETDEDGNQVKTTVELSQQN